MSESEERPAADKPTADKPTFEPSGGWLNKFRYAARGLKVGLKSQSSFWVHVPCAIAVLILATVTEASTVEVSLLLICIGAVFALELMNSAIEFLAKEFTQEENANVGHALDASAAAVLVAAGISVVIGLLVFVPKFLG